MKIEAPPFTLAVVSVSNFRSTVIREKVPVLLAYLHHGLEYKEQLGVVENIARHYGSALKVCLAAQEDFEAIGEACHTTGTPAFLFFERGRQKSHLLGQADETTLKAFIDNNTGSCCPQ